MESPINATSGDLSQMIELVKGSKDSMTTWSDERRKDFVRLFRERSEAAKYILNATAEVICERMLSRKLMNLKHVGKALGRSINARDSWYRFQYIGSDNMHGSIGGRPAAELIEIARDRATTVMKGLPPLQKIISIISPELGKKIEQKDKLFEKMVTLLHELDALNKPIVLSEFKDEKVSVVLANVKEREKKQKNLIEKINEIAKEGRELEIEVGKELHPGIPELTDSIIKVVQEHVERAIAMDQYGRRIHETVMFGDSALAQDLLNSFEKDEREVREDIRNEFANALERMKLLAKKAPAKLKS